MDGPARRQRDFVIKVVDHRPNYRFNSPEHLVKEWGIPVPVACDWARARRDMTEGLARRLDNQRN